MTITPGPRKVGRVAFLSVMEKGKPHVYRRNGRWLVYLPPSSFSQKGHGITSLGSSITDHRRAAGFMP